jgi:hypothetical protein
MYNGLTQTLRGFYDSLQILIAMFMNNITLLLLRGAWGSVVVKALRY